MSRQHSLPIGTRFHGGLTLIALLTAATLFAAPGDWPQWRGPDRTGVGNGGPFLASAWPAGGLTRVWTSEYIPSTTDTGYYKNNSDAGYSTPVVADGRVYQYYSWSIDGQWRDVFICLDATTGSTLWKTIYPAPEPVQSWGNSSTMCVAGGRCYGVGNWDNMVYCLNAADGSEIWKTNAAPWLTYGAWEATQVDSSFLVVDGVAVLQGRFLVAFDAATGSVLWSGDSEFAQYYGYPPSPTVWRKDGNAYVIASGYNQIVCVDLQTGALMWRRQVSNRLSDPPGNEGCASCTPTVSGDYMVVLANPDRGMGLYGYHMTTNGVELVWQIPELCDQGSSVAIRDGYVYVAANCGNEYRFYDAKAACYKLETGAVAWQVSLPCGDASSPVIVDGKFFATLNDGYSLIMAEATPDQYTELGRVTLSPRMLNFVTPVIANGKLFARTWNNIVCYDLLYVAPEATIVYDSGTADDSAGNGDGVINPGERVPLWVTLANSGSNGTAGVAAILTCADPYVTVTDNQAAFGDMPGLWAKKQAADPFEIQVASNCPTPRQVDLSMVIGDGAEKNWTASFKVMVNEVCQISGGVTLDGVPAAGVTVENTVIVKNRGPVKATRVTDEAGQYAFTFSAVPGTNTLTAKRNGWLDGAISLVAPPSTSGVNFAFLTAKVAGTVTDALTGNPLAGATVQYSGALTGSVTTAADGRHEFTRVYGRSTTLTVTAKKTGYFDSTRTVSVPPDALDVNFAMGYSDIDVTPTALAVTAVMGENPTGMLTIGNLGASNLTWTSTAAVIRELAMPADCAPNGIAFDGSVLWVSAKTYSGELYKLDPVTGTVLGTLDVSAIAGNRGGLEWDGVDLWMTDSGYNKINAVNRETGQLVKTLSSGASSYVGGVAAGGGYLWVMDVTPRKVLKVDPATGSVVGSWTIPAAVTGSVYGLEYLDGAIWVAAGYNGDGKVFQLSSTDGTVIASGQGPEKGIPDLADSGTEAMWLLSSSKKAYLVDLGAVLWLRYEPRSGTVAGCGSQAVPLTFDTTAAGLGVHQTTIRIRSNDADNPEVQVPVKFTVLPPGEQDSDGDGMSDANEILAGTDPTNRLSVLRLTDGESRIAEGEFVIRWQSASDRWYTVDAATDLLSGFTMNLRTNIPSTPPENVHTDSVGIAGQRFYRVKLE